MTHVCRRHVDLTPYVTIGMELRHVPVNLTLKEVHRIANQNVLLMKIVPATLLVYNRSVEILAQVLVVSTLTVML